MKTWTNATTSSPGARSERRRAHRVVVGVLLGVSAVVATAASAGAVRAPTPQALTPRTLFPVGTPNPNEPSRVAPTNASALPGFRLVLSQDFSGTRMPAGWGTFAGQPSGDPDAYWAQSHVLVSGGIVRLLTYRDPAYGMRWVSGGFCYCQNGHAYGAYFVRSRVTGPGPDENELLWPVANVWPPEVDFNENAYSPFRTAWTVHYGTGNAFVQRQRAVDLERWHTFGVVWTPTSLTFTLDGAPWGVITNTAIVPHRAMVLDVDQQARCNGTKWAACPTGRVALQVDWITEYVRG